MWKILFTAIAEKEIKLQFKSGLLTEDDREIIATWIKQVKEFGPESLRSSNFWYDHALDGKWDGFRSSAFSFSGRIIYKIENKQIIVKVVRVTSTHDYKI
jgi:mRNA-degrading endonuclease YafQ of YafQ-DinJ toxin-antitoxin module